MVSVFEVLSYLIDENLVAYILQFSDIIAVSHDGICEEWRFDIMSDSKTFCSIPN